VVSTDDGATTDAAATIAVHNPFAGTETVGWLETTFIRTIEISDETVVHLPHGTLHIVPAVADLTVRGTVGVPGPPIIDILENGRDRLVSWEQAIEGRIDDHLVTLFEIIDDPVAPLIQRHQIITDDTRAVIAANLLEPDHLYIVRVQARLGFPSAADAYYIDVELPFGHATTWSPAFTR
jgi:hypothetical protein